MNTFKKILFAIGAALLLSACGLFDSKPSEHDNRLARILENQGALDIEKEKTKQAQAAADSQRALAIQAGMARGDIAAAVGVAMLGAAEITKTISVGSAKSEPAVNPIYAALARPPEEAWEKYLRGFRMFTGGVSELATAVTPWAMAAEQGKTTRASFERDVRVEVARQTGETDRTGYITGSSRDVMIELARRSPGLVIQNSGDGNNFGSGSTSFAPVTNNNSNNPITNPPPPAPAPGP